jgi:adenylate cyclase
MRLRTILSLLFAILLVITDGFIGWIGYSSSRHALKRLTEQEFAIANASTTSQIGNFLDDPASRLLDELALRARRGMLSLNEDDALGFNLAERLRVNGDLAWISYSDAATGHFVGVWRRADGAVILNRSTPGQGPAREEIVTPDGQKIDFHRPGPANYDPRIFSWFKNAAASSATAWSEPYTFVEGDKGITASRAWRPDRSQTPAGVFTVDFHLDDLQRLLDGLAVHTRGFSCVLEFDGKIFCAAKNPDADKMAASLGDWVKLHPGFKNINGEAISHLIPVQVDGKKYLAALDRLETPSGFKCIVGSMAPETVIYAELNGATTQMALVIIVGLTLAMLAGWVLANRVSKPLNALGRDLARVGQFHLERDSSPRSMVSEVNQLRAAADLMKSGLRSFMRYVPDDLVRQLLSSGKEASLGGEIRRLTLIFSDIEGFTSHSERVPPDVLLDELSRYFEVLERNLRKHSGTLDKFMGDGMLGFFNAPAEVPQHERKACLATLEALQELRERQRDHPLTAFYTRVGLHSGDVLVGNIGTPEKFAYTVLGDVVNVASRLENLNKVYGTQVIASEQVRENAGDDFEWRHLDRIAVAGRRGQTNIFELLGMVGAVPDDWLRRRDLYQQALNDYFARSFTKARSEFDDLLRLDPEDKAAQLMKLRCEHMLTVKLSDDWDGVFAYNVK